MNVVHAEFRARARMLQAQRLQLQTEEVRFEFSTWPYYGALAVLYVVALYVHAKKFVCRMFNAVPRTNFWLVDGISVNSRRMKDGAARWPALNTVYNFTKGEGSTSLARVIDGFWMRIRNAQAVRNRLLIVKRELLQVILKVAETTDGLPVQILSLAAGTAQGVIEAVAEARKLGVETKVLLIDNDQSALEYALMLAKKYNVTDLVNICEGDALHFNRRLHGFRPHIVEMCGLMDYLKDGLALKLIRKIHTNLHIDGYFVTCHIHPNAEAYFLRQVVNWSMLYRSLDQFEYLLVDSGFLKPQFFTEPHGIHTVAVAQKLDMVRET